MNDLKNKVVLITGASSGIGAAAALAFGRYGARVAVHYRSQQASALSVVAQIQAAGSSAEAFGCDVMDSAQLVQLVQAVHALRSHRRADQQCGRHDSPHRFV